VVASECAAPPASARHSSRLVTDEPDSPHRRLDGVGASLYLGFGAEDDVTPPSVIPVLEHELDAHGIRHTAEVLPGAGHGFTMRDLPSFNAPAAQQAMEGAVALFQSQL
jgi:carboxymethylenebutenolidase